MIAALSREVVSDTARGEPLWFHPRACAVPRPDSAPPLGDSRIDHRPAIPDQGSLLVMTAQSISGSDVFRSGALDDLGRRGTHLERGAAGAGLRPPLPA